MKTIIKVCPICKGQSSVVLPRESYEAHALGLPIQNAWPEGSTTEREVLISGICPDCQAEVFKDE